MFISPIELQIPYKLYLGSDKEIEDAIYLWDIFKGKIEVNRLMGFMKALNVRGEGYGIEVLVVGKKQKASERKNVSQF